MEAGANRDFNSIHHNTEYARATGAPDMYANTLFLMGMWERCVRDWAGPGARILSLKGFRMDRFNLVGTTTTVTGSVTAVDAASGDVTIRMASRTPRASPSAPVKWSFDFRRAPKERDAGHRGAATRCLAGAAASTRRAGAPRPLVDPGAHPSEPAAVHPHVHPGGARRPPRSRSRLGRRRRLEGSRGRPGRHRCGRDRRPWRRRDARPPRPPRALGAAARGLRSLGGDASGRGGQPSGPGVGRWRSG